MESLLSRRVRHIILLSAITGRAPRISHKSSNTVPARRRLLSILVTCTRQVIVTVSTIPYRCSGVRRSALVVASWVENVVPAPVLTIYVITITPQKRRDSHGAAGHQQLNIQQPMADLGTAIKHRLHRLQHVLHEHHLDCTKDEALGTYEAFAAYCSLGSATARRRCQTPPM